MYSLLSQTQAVLLSSVKTLKGLINLACHAIYKLQNQNHQNCMVYTCII